MPHLEVTLVIPARDASKTIGPCLDSVVFLKEQGLISEIMVVDDGSKDETAQIIKQYPVTYVQGLGKGAGSARNLGWQKANTELV